MNIDFTPASSEFARVIRTRRTIAEFRPDSPPLEVILQGIDLARWAPNHKLTEPWRFHLIGPETAAKIIELNTQLTSRDQGEAVARKKRERWMQLPSGWLAISALRSDDPVRDQENYAAACCAVQNLSLYLWSEGIGLKWSTGQLTRDEGLFRLLHIDVEAERLVGLFWYGYPASIPEMTRNDVAEITAVHP